MNRRFNKFHVSKLRKWEENPTRFPTRRQINRPVAEIVDGNEKEWLVERILGERVLNNKLVEYLVLWEGYPTEDATWEPERNLKNAREVLESYKKQRDEEEMKNNEKELEEEVELENKEIQEEREMKNENKYEEDDRNEFISTPVIEEKEEEENNDMDWEIASGNRRSRRIMKRARNVH